MDISRSSLSLTPRKIAILYAAFGLFWITASDVIVFNLVASDQLLTTIQTLKGGLFVALSGALIWGLTSRREAQLEESRSRLEKISQQLHVLQRVFRHNIRNELNIVIGQIELAQEDDSRGNLRAARESADTVIDISEKIKIVDAYPISSDSSRAVDIADLMDTEVAKVRDSYPEATIETSLEGVTVVSGDDSIAYILRELLENAVTHYDDDPATLHLEIRCRREGDAVRLQIRDNGPGIPSYELEALEKGHETQLIHLSSVGLWVVQWLVERINGDIEFASDDHGTTVTVDFEPAPRSSPVEQPREPTGADIDSFTR